MKPYIIALILCCGAAAGYLDNKIDNLKKTIESQQLLLDAHERAIIHHNKVFKIVDDILVDIYEKLNKNFT